MLNTVKIAPCKGCSDRTATCHGTCQAYREWKLVRQRHYYALKKEAEVHDYEEKNRYFREEGKHR